MKKTSLLTSVALIASLGLVGCGGGGSTGSIASQSTGNTSSQNTSNVSVSGTAIDPELKGAIVRLDLNHDENCSEDEPTVTTDENGSFSLAMSTMQLEGSAPLLVIGGIDKESGEEFKGKLLADVNDSLQNITPLTTLAYEKMKENMGKSQEAIQSGMKEMKEILNLTSAEIQANMITLAEESNATALKVALALQKSAEALFPTDTVEFYKNLSPEINTTKAKDLTDAILNITPDELKMHVHSLMEDILDSGITDPYALADEAGTKAKELGIDQDEMIDEIPGVDNMPGADDIPGVDNMPGADDIPGVDNMPGADDIPGVDDVPGADDIPGVDDVPGADDIPGVNDVPRSSDISTKP